MPSDAPKKRRDYRGENRVRWRAAGACQYCGEPTPINPHTGKARSLCAYHMARELKRQARYWKTRIKAQRQARAADHRALAKQWRARRHATGRCILCPTKTGINPRTRKPFWECRACRVRISAGRAARARARYRRMVTNMSTKTRGFGSMDPEKRREVSRRGGIAVHAKGTGHKWNHDTGQVAGRKGGLAGGRSRGVSKVDGSGDPGGGQ